MVKQKKKSRNDCEVYRIGTTLEVNSVVLEIK